MKQRTTFFHSPEDGIDAERLKLSADTINGPEIRAVREDRLTVGLEELLGELSGALSGAVSGLLHGSNDLHVRWVSPEPHGAVAPIPSRLPPGLHVFFSPLGHGRTEPCRAMKILFGAVDCVSLEESFVNLRPGRFSSGASYQYHSNLPDLSHLIDTTTKSFCPGREEACLSHMSRLKAAQSLDLSYDHESQTLKATAVWPLQKQALVVSTAGRHRTEVGILTMDSRPNPEVHEQGVAGLLTVLGEQMKPSVTLFAFPSRHRQADGRFSAAFLAPTGLHPTLRLTVETTKPAPSDVKEDWNCGLYSYFTLPRVIFADKYQLNDPLFLASKNISTLSFISQPVDLEAPEYVMKIWGSSLLLELAPPKGNSKKESGPWTAHVPLHLRYLEPKEGGYSGVHIPYPAVFWACAGGAGGDGDGDGGVFAKSPFDRAHLGYDGLFEQKTLFWHVDPVPEPGAGVGGDSLMNVVIVPVADVEQTGWVSPVTLLVIMLGFGWVLERLFGALTRYRGERAIAEKVETKKTQ